MSTQVPVVGAERTAKALPDVGGRVDKVRVLAFPWKGGEVILSENIISFTWSEDASAAAVSGDLVIDNIGDIARKIMPGTWLVPQFFDPQTQKWHNLDPPLYVWERSLTDAYNRTSTITALDIVSFLQRQGAQNWLFRDEEQHPGGWTASQIAQQVVVDLGLKSALFKTHTKIPYLYLQNHTPYEAIVKAYTRDRQLTHIRYRIQAVGRKVVVKPFLSQDRVWQIAEGSNLYSAEWTESLDNLYTQIILLSTTTSKTTGAPAANATSSVNAPAVVTRGMRFTSTNVKRFGIIRNVIIFDKDVKASALKGIGKELLKLAQKLTRKVTISAEGLMPLRAGDLIYFNDGATKLHGNFFVSSISHSITAGAHQMDIELSYTDIVPVLYPTRDELVERTDKALIGTRAELAGPLGVAWYPPLGTTTYKVLRGPGGTGPHSFDAAPNDWLTDSAVDLQVPVGTQVFACMNGTVMGIGGNANGVSGHLAGFHLGIQSEIGKPSAYYAHLQKIEPSIYNGKKVKLGDLLGTVGLKDVPVTPDAPNATFNYLHFALSEGSFADKDSSKGINPLHWVSTAEMRNPAQETQPAGAGIVPQGVPEASDVAGTNKMISDIASYIRTKGALYAGGPNMAYAGVAQYIVTQGQAKGVDPRFLVAVSRIESQLGVSDDGVKLKNPLGLGPHNLYHSYEDAVSAFYTSVIGPAYYGARDIAHIQVHYNPGEHQDWIDKVSEFFRELGGDPNRDVIWTV